MSHHGASAAENIAVGEMLRKIGTLIPYWRRIDDQKYYDSLLDLLRFMSGSLHDPWRAQNPWAYSLEHGQLYRCPKIRNLLPMRDDEKFRVFRMVLEFDRDDFDRWKRAAKNIPKDRFMDAFAVPVRCRWMIEEMERMESDGIVGAAIPGSRRPIDRETWEKLDRLDGRLAALDGDDSMA